jgi:hypothetical protein
VTVVSASAQKLGAYIFVVLDVAPPGNGLHLFEAFVQLPGDLSYLFNTCNANSRVDLLTILRAFQVRAGS